MVDISALNPSLFGRFSFTHSDKAPHKSPFPPGRNSLGIADERDAVLYVPESLDTTKPVPLLVMFHGAGGYAEKVLPFLELHADQHGFLLLAPQSQFPTWDIVIAGSGPDIERLDAAFIEVASRYSLDKERFGFAGFSDGGSYSLSIGITNGSVVTHVIAFSAGFMSVFMPAGRPQVFIAHGLVDEQLPIETSGRANAAKLKDTGYVVEYVEFNGKHVIQPPIVALAVDFFMNKQPANSDSGDL